MYAALSNILNIIRAQQILSISSTSAVLQSLQAFFFAVMAETFCFYNIGWFGSRFNNLRRHSETLAADLSEAFVEQEADVVLLCGCGVMGEGLETHGPWLQTQLS